MGDRDELTFKFYGSDQFNRDADGELFARRFFKFMQGLHEADKAANGRRVHRFLISDLHRSSASASVREQLTAADHARPQSSFDYYEGALVAVRNDSPVARDLPIKLVKYFVDISNGSGGFVGAEVRRERTGVVIHIDKILEERAKRVLGDIDRQQTGALPLYRGAAYGAFDGRLRVLEDRDGADRVTIKLTAGGKEIECTVIGIDPEELGRAYKRRCIVRGLAHYSGEHGLPERIDIREIQVVERAEGLDAWRGSFNLPAPDDDIRG